MEELRFPVGRFVPPAEVTPEAVAGWIADLEALPGALRRAVDGLNDGQLDTPYRPEGWTVRQVVHHVADSHVNSYLRFKFAIAEESPTIKPYDEEVWARMADASGLDVEPSLRLLEGLHARWTVFLRSLGPDAFARTLTHPEIGKITVGFLCALYAWHSRHHVAHVTGLRSRMGW